MAIRAVPQQSILDCLPTAVEIADLRVVNKDLNFIQANIKRADDLATQVLSANDYSQLVSITDKFSSLAQRAQDRSETLKEFSKDSNPLTQINDSSQFLDKAQVLSKNLEQKTTELSGQFISLVDSKYENYNNSIGDLSQSISSLSSYSEFAASYQNFASLLKNIEEDARYLNSNNNAGQFLNKIEDLVKQYQDKAEIYSASFQSEMGIQIDIINQQISSLSANIDSLNSSYGVDTHLEKLSELREVVNSSASQFKTVSGSEEMVLNLNNLSLVSHAKVEDMVNGYKAIEKLIPQVNDPEILAHTVREVSFRTNTSYIDNLLMPLIDNPNQLSTKALEIAAMDDNEITIQSVISHEGDPAKLGQLYFVVTFTDDPTVTVTLPYKEVKYVQLVREYINRHKRELHIAAADLRKRDEALPPKRITRISQTLKDMEY